ncbi:polymorphic toxin type 30 domain-containing protein [Proteus mirabilis]|uniref:polymorphic toxin type 30 domain-containing protein n=1 Tax=Proteus mirabilis TaxID=584 RepID=UPI0015830D8F|nr:polymorphic toxin type 30 domain-containing protein [Proteus mirabilis]MDC9758565.1 polymorphic toxin type 30 domain-containing protein [Proteus mirabilis]MDF7239154.1 polymorphic toxin type 30 domain-containing protein [Proteus mirabilis]WIF56098.1 polymorphic toxin type 30 domain-containing protein [Proteus mirabilis]HEJ9721967.1 hypothetical protein [Proteus mirabilis]
MGGQNPYGYVHCPTGYIDLFGLTCCPTTLSGNTIKKFDGSDLITIPENAKVRKLIPTKGYIGDYGYEYKWKNTNGGTTTVRIHGIGETAPAGTNASQGWVVRIMDGKKVWILMEIIILPVFLTQTALIIIHH